MQELFCNELSLEELKCSLKKCSIKFYEEIFVFFLTKLRPFFEFGMLWAFSIFFTAILHPKPLGTSLVTSFRWLMVGNSI